MKSDGWDIYLLRWRGGLALRTSTGKILCELEEGMDRWTDGLRKGCMDCDESRGVYGKQAFESALVHSRDKQGCVPKPKATAASVWQQLFIGNCCLYY